jgi:hypothetical protein
MTKAGGSSTPGKSNVPTNGKPNRPSSTNSPAAMFTESGLERMCVFLLRLVESELPSHRSMTEGGLLAHELYALFCAALAKTVCLDASIHPIAEKAFSRKLVCSRSNRYMPHYDRYRTPPQDVVVSHKFAVVGARLGRVAGTGSQVRKLARAVTFGHDGHRSGRGTSRV